jgi:hypothetical protein
MKFTERQIRYARFYVFPDKTGNVHPTMINAHFNINSKYEATGSLLYLILIFECEKDGTIATNKKLFFERKLYYRGKL